MRKVRKFRFVGTETEAVEYEGLQPVRGQIYRGDCRVACLSVEYFATESKYTHEWKEVFEEDQETLEDRVTEIEMSYVGAEHFEEVVGMLSRRIKVLEGLISENKVCAKPEKLYKFVGDSSNYYWDKNPEKGVVYTNAQLSKMFGKGFTSLERNADLNDWQEVRDNVVCADKESLPQKYQVIEVRVSEDCDWYKRIFVSYDGRYVTCVANTGDGIDETDFSITTDWEHWRFIED